MFTQPVPRGLPFFQQAWNLFNEQGKRDIKGIEAELGSQSHTQGLVELGHRQDQPHLLLDMHPFATPKVLQAQIFFECQKSEFDIPAPCIQLGDLSQAQLPGVIHIADVAAELLPSKKRTNRTSEPAWFLLSAPRQTNASSTWSCW